jgi:hypothetical protein
MRGEQGHGYDPIFQPEGHDVTFGEMDRWEKNRISHRGRAFAKLVRSLNDRTWTRRRISASTSTGRSARPNAPIAISTATSHAAMDQERWKSAYLSEIARFAEKPGEITLEANPSSVEIASLPRVSRGRCESCIASGCRL